MTLYSEVKSFSMRLRSAALWHAEEVAVAHVFDNTTARSNNYIYEFYVLTRLLDNLTSNYRLVYKADANGKHLFPKAASKKANHPYFEVYDKVSGQLLCQICAGTEVNNEYGHIINPDISIQKPTSSLNPKSEDLIMIIDAKHKKNPNARITSDDVKVFLMDVRNYKINKEHYNVNFHPPFDCIDCCALITNGLPHLDLDPMLKDYNSMILYQFFPGLIHSVSR